MQRFSAAALGLLFVGAVLLVVLRAHRPDTGEPVDPVAAEPAESAAPAETPAASDPADAGGEPNSGPASGEFSVFPDGGSVPKLPPDAPTTVQLGVILYRYQGAQYADSEAPSKEAALSKAVAALELARQDFEAAVKQGDPGSTADAGRIPRGVLEPPVEYVVFSVPPGTVHDTPIDTPRGYWIVRRIK